MGKGILVFVEQRDGRLRKASFEALSEARRQGERMNEPVTALLVGDKISDLAAEVVKYKPTKILLAEDASFAQYSSEGYANALSAAVKQEDPRYVFAAFSAMSKDFVPRVAARFEAPCASDVTELRADGNDLLALRPMYSGKSFALLGFRSPIVFITMRPNNFALVDTSTNHAQSQVEKLAVTAGDVRAKVTATHASAGGKVELTEASIIVSGGRGIKGPENWGVLENLCDALGAALGASRAVVDAGWIDHQHQVGQTGKVVSPQLYIACGISGAIQHLAGMSSSKVVVAINKNPDAQIFKNATYGIVGDMFEIVPKLTEEVKKYRENN